MSFCSRNCASLWRQYPVEFTCSVFGKSILFMQAPTCKWGRARRTTATALRRDGWPISRTLTHSLAASVSSFRERYRLLGLVGCKFQLSEEVHSILQNTIFSLILFSASTYWTNSEMKASRCCTCWWIKIQNNKLNMESAVHFLKADQVPYHSWHGVSQGVNFTDHEKDMKIALVFSPLLALLVLVLVNLEPFRTDNVSSMFRN